MKIPATLLALGLAAPALFSQTQEGSFLLGSTANLTGGIVGLVSGVPNQAGIMSLKHTRFKGGNAHSDALTVINFSPNFAYFMADGVALGASVGIAHLESDGDPETYASAAPFVRCYFMKGKKVSPFAEVSGGYFFQANGPEKEDREKQPFFAGRLGSAFILNPHLSLDLFVDGLRSKDKETTSTFKRTTTTTVVGFGLGFSWFLK